MSFTGEEEQEFDDDNNEAEEGPIIGVLPENQSMPLRLSDCETVEEIMMWLQHYTKNPKADTARLARTIYRAAHQTTKQLTEDNLEVLLDEWIEDVSSLLQDYDGKIPEHKVNGTFGFKVRGNWHNCVVDLLSVITKSLIHRFNQDEKSEINFRATAFFRKIAKHAKEYKKHHQPERKSGGAISSGTLTTKEEIEAADSLLREMIGILQALKDRSSSQDTLWDPVKNILIGNLTDETARALREAARL